LKLSKLIFILYVYQQLRDLNPFRTGTAGEDKAFHALGERLIDFVANTALNLDSFLISGIFLPKFLVKKGGKVNDKRYHGFPTTPLPEE
jgi:hypothetical protein